MNDTNCKSTFYKLSNKNQGLKSVYEFKINTDADDKLITSLHNSKRKLVKLHDEEFRN